MIDQSMKGHGRLPDPIANAPSLFPWLAPYYTAFEELLSERSEDGFSGETGPIPWTAVNQYALRHAGLFGDFEKLLTYVKTLDYHHRKLIRAARPKPDKSKPGKPPTKTASRPPPRRRK